MLLAEIKPWNLSLAANMKMLFASARKGSRAVSASSATLVLMSALIIK
jgi:hypothetical protein